jgi:uncharacterized RDD family membrane protein YckC
VKCPKCHYLSFDPEPRCRNCGYTLTLDPDLAIHPDETPEAPLVDLALRDPGTPRTPSAREERPRPAGGRRGAAASQVEPVRRPRTTTPGPFDDPSDEPVEVPAPDEAPNLFESEESPSAELASVEPAVPVRARRQPPPPTTELPLFVKGMGTDTAAATSPPASAPTDVARVDPPVASAPPVSERRPATPAPIKARTVEPQKLGPLDRDLLEGLERIEHAEQRRAAAEARRVEVEHRSEHRGEAGRRLGAAAVDALLLGALSAGIVWVTLRWTGLPWSQIHVLPAAPVVAFVLLVVVGYLFMFTAASGQTAGKMLMGIRVVDAGRHGPDDGRVSVRQALYRGALTVPSVLLLGLGFLPALGAGGRALHDRLTQTRVVRA